MRGGMRSAIEIGPSSWTSHAAIPARIGPAGALRERPRRPLGGVRTHDVNEIARLAVCENAGDGLGEVTVVEELL